MTPWMARPLGLAGIFALASLGGAQAAELRTFRLPAEPLDAALVRFAIQGAVSVGGYPVPGCAGHSRPVLGLMAPGAALKAMLPAGCDFRPVDAHSFRIVAQLPPRPPPSGPTARTAAAVDELVVTAEKRPEPLTGSAYAVTALPSDEIRRLGGKSFADVAPQIAGVTVTNLGSGRNKIFIRGLSDGSFTGQTQSTVGLYLDDVPITYSAPDPDLRLVDVDRVEVLRGPQGTLYGSGSIGGIVRIVTNRPDPGAFAGVVSVDGAGAEHGASSSGIDGTLNIPLPVLGGGAIRMSAYRDVRGGYIDNPRLGLTDVNDSTRSGGRVAAALPLPDGWRILAGYALQSIDTRDSQYTDGSGLARDTQVREPHDNDFAEASLTLTHEGAGADLKMSAAFIDHGLDTRYDATGALGSVGPTAFDESRQVDFSVVEAVLTSTAAGRWRWLAGLFASQADETDAARLTPVPASGLGRFVYRRHDQLTEAAAYGEAAFDLTSRITLTAGGRFFTGYLKSKAGDFDLAATPTLATRNHEKTGGFAPKLRASYALAPDTVIYAQLQEGYRAGGFNIPAAASGAPTDPTVVTAFKPDRLLSYEVGMVWPLLSHTVTLRAALFRANWKHLQTDQYLPSGLPMTVNIGDGSNTGLEAEAVWRPDSHWQVRVNLLAEDPEITKVSDAFPASVDIGLPGVPSLLASGDLRYRWTIGPRLKAELSAQYAYVGRSYLTFDGAAASAMGGYGSGRIGVALEQDRWRVEAYLDNVTDQVGNTFAFGNPFSRARTTQATPLRPRTLGIAVDRSF
jgi:outer membrane receptor protein involved in Fe transport